MIRLLPTINYLMDIDMASSNDLIAKKVGGWTKEEKNDLMLAKGLPMIKLERSKHSFAQIRE